jgi:hypothetical protein
MVDKTDMKGELLKQMDGDSAGASNAKPDSAQRIIEMYAAQVRRLKWVTAVSWLITIVYFLAMHMLKDALLENDLQYFLTRDAFLLMRYSDMGLKVLLVIAVILTVALYLKSRTLTIQQISARLAGIEEQLKNMSQSK